MPATQNPQTSPDLHPGLFPGLGRFVGPYASLTGNGQTASPGSLTQTGDLAVTGSLSNTGQSVALTATSLGVDLTDSSAGGSGIALSSSNGPVVLTAGLLAASAQSRFVGTVNGESPAVAFPAVPFQLLDWALDGTGAIWICKAAGTPGTWICLGGRTLSSYLTSNLALTAGVNTQVTSLSLPPGLWTVSVMIDSSASSGTYGQYAWVGPNSASTTGAYFSMEWIGPSNQTSFSMTGNVDLTSASSNTTVYLNVNSGNGGTLHYQSLNLSLPNITGMSARG